MSVRDRYELFTWERANSGKYGWSKHKGNKNIARETTKSDVNALLPKVSESRHWMVGDVVHDGDGKIKVWQDEWGRIRACHIILG